jgi:hypothetical protein
MSNTKLMTTTALLGLVLSACAAQVEGDEDVGDVGQVAPTAAALNRAFDFKVGIIGIRYDSQGRLTKSTEAWSNPFSYYNGLGSGFSDSPYTSRLPGATGFRVGIKANGGAGSGPLFTDFRLRIQTRNSATGLEGPLETTSWISELVGGPYTSVNTTFDPFGLFDPAGWDQFKIGFDVRWWPTSRSANEFTDMQLSAGSCSADAEATCGEIDVQSTKWLSKLAPGEVSWSRTAAPIDGAPVAYVELALTGNAK